LQIDWQALEWILANSMSSLQRLLDDTLLRLRRADTDLQDVEVKDASRGTPGALPDIISAFATGTGGLLILGLSEADGFEPTAIDASALADAVATACANDLDPPVRPDIDICAVDDMPVVVVSIDELPTDMKPCHVRSKGLERGVFVRTHDGLRRMTTYEIHLLLASRGQPRDDRAPVPGSGVADLDRALVDLLIEKLRADRGPTFRDAPEAEILDYVGVTVTDGGDTLLTLAGLLALGRYPQRYFPQLDITFVAYPDVTGEPLRDGTRFLDNQSIDGSIPTMLSMALATMRRNMKRRGIVVGIGREDRWDYPEEVIRELIVNALMHRDYHPMAHGTQVRMSLYPDRLEISNPGGFHGPIAKDSLMVETVDSISRNATLAKLLEAVRTPVDRRIIAENRGTGLVVAATLLRRVGMSPPELVDRLHRLTATLSNDGLLDEDTLRWLETMDNRSLNERQRLALAFARRQGVIDNRRYRTVTGCDAAAATRELAGLAASGFLEKRGDRSGTTWALARDLAPQPSKNTSDLSHAPVPEQRRHRDRRELILEVLKRGSASSAEIAGAVGVGQRGAQNWLMRMEAEGTVERTETLRTSRRNRWQLRPADDV